MGMYVEKNPRPPDFCGRVGCPICYDFVEGSSINEGTRKFAEDLLGRQAKNDEERAKLAELANKIHVGGYEALKQPVPEPPSFGAVFSENPTPEHTPDIGMSTAARVNLHLKLRGQNKPQKPLVKSIDQLADEGVLEGIIQNLPSDPVPVEEEVRMRERYPDEDPRRYRERMIRKQQQYQMMNLGNKFERQRYAREMRDDLVRTNSPGRQEPTRKKMFIRALQEDPRLKNVPSQFIDWIVTRAGPLSSSQVLNAWDRERGANKVPKPIPVDAKVIEEKVWDFITIDIEKR